MHSTARSPLSGIPVRALPAATVSPMQRTSIKPSAKTLEKRIHRAEFSHQYNKLSGCSDDLKPTSLMRKSPSSLESVIKSTPSFSSHVAPPKG
ncbi:hypothetical protein D4764_14G0003990 [Takifugu flavidus]|uniref:Uncharacterized protein n=1 Tax=Takifugu flavidus TaxID=433684 RepID=A0A5C6P5K5_9TELE|nr:hypothetical protein D4764_14G0003990 [Takifugu flavidus]